MWVIYSERQEVFVLKAPSILKCLITCFWGFAVGFIHTAVSKSGHCLTDESPLQFHYAEK